MAFLKRMFIVSVFLMSIVLDAKAENKQKTDVNFMPVGKHVMPPLAFVQYCLRNYDECTNKVPTEDRITMSERLKLDMEEVQAFVNTIIKPLSDMDNVGVADSWGYPSNQYGDCEDYAILKKRLLVARGWSKNALLLTTAITEKGEAHVVLTVASSGGDFILDNRMKTVEAWENMQYRWLARQDGKNQLTWNVAAPQTNIASLR
jgi:predicted transglutaminase-like cysteine proteinase